MLSAHPDTPKRLLDWGRIARDYALYRPAPPDSYFARLQERGVGLKEQNILDLGTGSGLIARGFAARGARVVGVDLVPELVREAGKQAREEFVDAHFVVGDVADLPLPDAWFDVLTAHQCWGDFEAGAASREAARVLRPGGRLVISHFAWLPRESEIAQASERLILKHNPHWGSFNWSGQAPPVSVEGEFRLLAALSFDEEVAFNRESWRGRLRTSRGIGPVLSEPDLRRFDREVEDMLKRRAPGEFRIPHRVDLRLYEI
ncbi:MAG: class I SAM-dependent methyltransferase [Bdellovibrionaceae bacterium]|nr:class I SAM-dependent methyltransferase [Pseudobdellovibrionaceae bacterium]MBX3035043.1 class I SAM-dependent methyltransferase [Pseudobdellovibrionaceae bacterium]